MIQHRHDIKNRSDNSTMRVFAFLTLLLLLKPDHAFSFGLGGLSITGNGRHSHESSSAFARSRDRSTLTTTCNQPLEKMTTIRPRKSDAGVRLNAVMDIVGVSPEPIHSAFAFATFGPQPFWLLMILLPSNEFTKKIMGKMGKSSFARTSYHDHIAIYRIRPSLECVRNI